MGRGTVGKEKNEILNHKGSQRKNIRYTKGKTVRTTFVFF
jgi:hypothetical protein